LVQSFRLQEYPITHAGATGDCVLQVNVKLDR